MPVLLKPSLRLVGDNLLKLEILLQAKQPMQDVKLNVQLPFCELLMSSSTGSCEFTKSNQLSWYIGNIEKDTVLTATLTTTGDDFKGELLEFKVGYKIGMVTISGVSIEGLAVQNENYKPFKGGRSVVNSSNCVYRYHL